MLQPFALYTQGNNTSFDLSSANGFVVGFFVLFVGWLRVCLLLGFCLWQCAVSRVSRGAAVVGETKKNDHVQNGKIINTTAITLRMQPSRVADAIASNIWDVCFFF